MATNSVHGYLVSQAMAFFCDEIVEWLQSPSDSIDSLLAAAVEQYESGLDLLGLHSAPGPNNDGASHSAHDVSAHKASPSLGVTSSSRPFAPAKSDAEIELARAQGIPKKTQEDAKYCVNLSDAWRSHRLESTGHAIKPIAQLNRCELEHWLTRFVLEVRKKDGSEFPPNSLHHICCGLMRHLRWNGQPSIDFFSDSDFTNFKASLDAEMKRLQSEGVGSKKRQAEVLTEDEDLL